MRRIHLPTMRELMENCVPRVHPNGFIQMDLDARHRLHVWHPRLPYRQRTYSPVHDHVFGFTSEVFSGRLVNASYSLVKTPNGTHYKAWCEMTGPNESVLVPQTHYLYRLKSRASFAVQPGEQYELSAFEFHETLSNEPTLTVIRKDDDTIYQGNERSPTVMVPRGTAPDNDFRRDDVDLDVLLELVEEAYP